MAINDVSDRSISELISLDGRVALVTGAARGIGLAVSRRLAEAGARVALGDIDETAAKEAASQLGGLAVHLDVTDGTSVSVAVERVVSELGAINILVNNAGIYPPGPFMDQTDEQWHKVLGVNLDGSMRCSREVAKRMVTSGGGVIVNISSIEGHRAGAPGLCAYVTSKHAVEGLTKSMAVELGPAGIRVVAVSPTIVQTPGLDELAPMIEAAGLGNIVEQLASRVPLGRAAQPDDVARMVLVCASDLAMLVTGSTVFVDAGAMCL
jgi:NAD(P)-dependent dehydrogenase (short-subunit alcohol dehydrogenase family)